ncbi:hypothetical protein AB0H51_27875 [Streptomyces griseoluteus]|uniref:hypothetical protein n=1 Tax=Streptomyces griseoluteus TaxID=29306 RepID=UPI0033F7E442
MSTATVQGPTAVWDARSLAAWLADNNAPGRRSMTAINQLRRERARRNAPTPRPLPLERRARAMFEARIYREIRRRGGETEIVGKFGTEYLDIADRSGRLVLMHAEGYRAYGKRNPARWATLSYLWGPDDAGSGPWAVRVPGTITTVREALGWLTPAAVKKAEEKGLRVRRQGDVYAIETTKRRDGDGVADLPDGHQWRPGTRYLVHTPADGRKHRPVRLPFPVRFVVQSAYEMGRSGDRANGD